MELYPPTLEEIDRINRDFTYHSPTPDQVERYAELRAKARDLAHTFLQLCPPSRERSNALTRLEEAVFHANASIARNERTVVQMPQSGVSPVSVSQEI